MVDFSGVAVTGCYCYGLFMGKATGTRVNLTLPPELVAVLDRIGSTTGIGRASYIREMLMQSLPTFEAMAQALDQAYAQNLDAFNTLTKAVDEVRTRSDQIGLDLKSKHRRMARKKKPRA